MRTMRRTDLSNHTLGTTNGQKYRINETGLEPEGNGRSAVTKERDVSDAEVGDISDGNVGTHRDAPAPVTNLDGISGIIVKKDTCPLGRERPSTKAGTMTQKNKKGDNHGASYVSKVANKEDGRRDSRHDKNLGYSQLTARTTEVIRKNQWAKGLE